MAERHDGDGRVSGSGERLVKSAFRVMQVFEFFGDRRLPATATEIARALGFPQSSTSMLLKSLVTQGYLDYRHDTRSFRPTIRLSLLGGWVPERLSVADRLLRLLAGLHEATGETVLLGAQHRHFVRCIAVQSGAASETPGTGSLWPLSTHAMGLALLTLKAETEIRGIVRRANAEEPDAAARVGAGLLLERLDRVRAQGFARTEEFRPEGPVSTVALLLPPQEDGMPLAVAVAGSTARLLANESAVLRQMRDWIGRLDRDPPPEGRRAAAVGERRDAAFPRPDLHLVHSRRPVAGEPPTGN